MQNIKKENKTKKSFLYILTLNLLILFFLIFFIFIVAEAYLRLTILGSSGDSIFSYTMDTKRYKVMKRDTKIVAWGEELRTNELGFRDNKSDFPDKQEDEFRIIVLGDSFTVSAGVKFESIYTTLLGDLLEKKHPDVKVYNLAVGGYNIVQYEMVLDEVALQLKPDLLLVSVFPTNDFSMDTYDDNYAEASGQSTKPESTWYKETYVYQAFLWRVFAKIQPAKVEDLSVTRGKSEQGWQKNLAALERIITKAKQNNLPVLITSLPDTWGYEAQRKAADRLEAFLKEQNVPYFILLDSFAGSGVKEPDLRLNLLDSHPNEKYNTMVAEYLLPFLDKNISQKTE